MNFVETEPGTEPIIVEGHFPVPSSRVFRAWTKPDSIMKWFGREPGTLAAAAIDLRPGGRWRFTEESDDHSSVGFEGHYIEVVEDRLLVFSWSKFTVHASGTREVSPLSRVEIIFRPTATGTHMRVTHSDLDSPETRLGFSVGWKGGVRNLAALMSHIDDRQS